jgi:DNA-binding MarR family transcriptional regulator
LLDRLEFAGLIARERSSEDRRFVTTRITEEALRLLAELDGAVVELHRRQFAGLNRSDLRRLVGLLELVRESA